MFLEKAGFHILDCCSGKDEPNPTKGCRELKKPNSNNEDTASSILEESNRLVHNYIIFLTLSREKYTLSIIKRTQHTPAKFCNSFISVSFSTQLCIPRRNGKYSPWSRRVKTICRDQIHHVLLLGKKTKSPKI